MTRIAGLERRRRDVVAAAPDLHLRFAVLGDTGSASACHLHFEVWTEPGWYNGGSPVDPVPRSPGGGAPVGIELAEKIHQQRPDLTIVFMSGYGGDFFSKETRGTEAVLFKPFGKEQLLNAVAVALDEGRSR